MSQLFAIEKPIIQHLINAGILTTTEPLNFETVYKLDSEIYTNVLVNYKLLEKNEESIYAISNYVELLLAPQLQKFLVIEPQTYVKEEKHTITFIQSIIHSLKIEEISLKELRKSVQNDRLVLLIAGNYSSDVVEFLYDEIRRIDRIFCLLGPSDPLLTRNWGDSSEKFFVLINIDKIDTLTNDYKNKMILGIDSSLLSISTM